MKRVLLIQLALFACTFSVCAQQTPPQSIPIETSTIDIELDEFGKGKLPGFALIKGQKYDINIVIDKPEKQHEAFIKGLVTRLEASYDSLDFGQNLTFYSYIWKNEFDQLRREIRSLADILKSTDPRAVLAAAPDGSFEHFLGKKFLLDALFDKSFKVACNIQKTEQEGSSASKQTIALSGVEAKDDTLKVQVYVADFEKLFIEKFFNEGKKAWTVTLPRRPQRFYYEMEQLKLLKTSIKELQKLFDVNPGYIFCHRFLAEKFKEINGRYTSNATAVAFESGWVKDWIMQWMWFDGAKLALNPLGFTDESRLPFRTGYDSDKARYYDEYRSNALAYMLDIGNTGDQRVDFMMFDSILAQKGLGPAKFDYRNFNETMKASNKMAAEQKQLIFSNISTVKFAVIADDKKDEYVYRHFDAANDLTGTTPDTGPAMSNKNKVSVAVYNLKPDELFSLQEKPVEIKNESAAITQLNQAGDMLSGLMTGAAPLSQILSAFAGSFRSPDLVPIPAQITAVDYLKKFDDNGIKGEKSGRIEVENIQIVAGLLLVKTLESYKIEKCFSELDERKALLALLLARLNKLNKPIDSPEIILAEAEKMIREMIEADNATRAFMENELAKFISVLDIITNPAFYTLPPEKIEPTKSKQPQYRNELLAINEESKAVKKNLDILVTNQKTGKEVLKKKDSYKTAPPTRITASLGATWVMSSFARNEMKMEGGVITGKTDKERLRVIAGIHYQLAPLILADDRSIFKLKGKELLSRFSIFGGFSFPKPFYNLHPGVAADIYTGVKVVATTHFFRYTNYTMMNGQIIDEKSKMVYNGITLGVSLEPVTFIKLIGILK